MAKGHFGEIGRSGLRVTGGYIREEFLKELVGTKGMAVYREMADNDAIVGAILYALEALFKQVEWRVEAAEDSGAQGEQAAAFVEECLADMSQPWQATLSEIASMLTYGFACFEVVYKYRRGPGGDPASRFADGRVGWRKWAIRAQETLDEWAFDEGGGLKGVWQAPPDGAPRIFIPIEKCLLFRTNTRRGNPEGRSLLRNAYISYYYKRRIQEIEGIGIERDLAGLPVLQPPENTNLFDDSDPEMVTMKASAETLVKNIRRDQQEGVLLPFGWTLTLLSSGSRRQFDTNAIIARYDERIAMSILADFILIGHDAVGSKALATSKVHVFTQAMKSIIDAVCDVVNRVAIPRLAELNGWPMERMPELKASNIEPLDLAEVGAYLQQLSTIGMPVFPAPELQRFLLEAAKLPVTEEDDAAREQAEAEKKQMEQDRFGLEQQAVEAQVTQKQTALKPVPKKQSA